jgi:hypothetical protein
MSFFFVVAVKVYVAIDDQAAPGCTAQTHPPKA